MVVVKKRSPKRPSLVKTAEEVKVQAVATDNAALENKKTATSESKKSVAAKQSKKVAEKAKPKAVAEPKKKVVPEPKVSDTQLDYGFEDLRSAIDEGYSNAAQPAAESTVKNKGKKGDTSFKGWIKLKKTLSLAAATVVLAVGVVAATIVGSNASKDAKQTKEFVDAFNNNITATQAVAADNATTSQNAFNVVDGIFTQTENLQTKKVAKVSTVKDAVSDIESQYNVAKENNDVVQSEYEKAFGENNTQSLLNQFEEKYNAEDYNAAKQIAESINQSAQKIANLTGQVVETTSEIRAIFENLTNNENQAAKEIANNYYTSTIPELDGIITNDLLAADAAVKLAKENLDKINASNADEIFKTTALESYNAAVANRDEAYRIYSEEYQSIRDDFEAAYSANNYAEVARIGQELVAKATPINAAAAQSSENATTVVEQYTISQEKIAADQYYIGTIPNLNKLVAEDISAADKAASTTESNSQKINETDAEQSLKDSLAELAQQAKDAKASADAEHTNYQDILSQINAAYSSGDYKTVSELGKDLIDSATLINTFVTEANTALSESTSEYTEYQENTNEALNKPVIEITFTDAELQNFIKSYGIYLIDADLGGRVNSIDSFTYSKNGEVKILASCTDMANNAYTNLITATVAANLTEQQISASDLMDRIKSASDLKFQSFDTQLPAAENAENGILQVGDSAIDGDIDITYSIDTVYNAKTKKTTITSSAIAIITDENGKVQGFKVYELDKSVRSGNVSEDAVEEELVQKLTEKIYGDSSLQIQDSESEMQ